MSKGLNGPFLSHGSRLYRAVFGQLPTPPFYIAVGHRGEVGTLGEVFPHEPVSVLVRASLP
jgi:hypothetical protein